MLTIPELAGNYIESAFQHNVQTTRSIFIAGSKSVGKTTLLHHYLDITDNPKETLTLEYSFGRKSKLRNINSEKSVCHNWEYGGRLDLLPDVLKSLNKDLSNMTMVIMVDLSKPKMLWNTLEICLQAFTAQLLDRNLSIPLIIIGAKYDLFKDFDPGLKMVICSTLRCIGLIQNASIYLYSSKDPALVKRMKDIFNYHGFSHGSLTKDKIFNHNKALCINHGTDSWDNIGVKECTFQDVKYTYVSRFPQDIFNEFEINQSNNQSSHVEILIDSEYKKICDNLQVT